MLGLSRAIWLIPFWLLFSSSCLADEEHIVDHHDPITIDVQLTLADTINRTLEQYPEGMLIPAMQEEAAALQKRGDSWLGGAPSAAFYYWDDMFGDNTGVREIEGVMEFPLWNWGQRDAGQELAEQAHKSSSLYARAVRLQVAGLVRNSLWNIKIQSNRHDMARKAYKVSEKLMHTVERRVELGDLPRADLLLAKSELLNKRSQLVNAEAEAMHARKRYTSLTRMETAPGTINEIQSPQQSIQAEHPMLAALNANVERKRAELKWIRAEGNGQSIVGLGGKSDRDSHLDDGATGMTFSISVPFGGSTFSGPEVAEVNMQLYQSIVERDLYFRKLEEAFHEAEHALEVDRAELEISREGKEIAQEHLKITQLSFDSGEIDLIDLLKIQARSFAAIQQASEHALLLQRDIALFNQVVGVQP